MARAYGEHLADRFYLGKPKMHRARSLARGELAVTEIKSNFPTPEPSRPIAYDEAYLVALMVQDVADHELWQEGRAARTPAFAAGETALFDLRRNPVNFCRTPHHSMHFYLPRATLNAIAEQNDIPFDGELNFRFASSYDDATIRHLGAATLLALEEGSAASGLFLDHILNAVAAHVLGRYGQGTAASVPPEIRGGLTPQQLRRTQEVMRSKLAEDVTLGALAAECGLSQTHFIRAFKQSTGTTPYAWLQQRRIERARVLLATTDLSLKEIAIDCGFADQSHLTRNFTRRVGVSPARWRRGGRGASRLG